LLLFSKRTIAQGPQRPFKWNERFISSAGIHYSTLDNYAKEKLYGLNFAPSLNLLNHFSDFSVSVASNISGAYHPSEKNDSINYFLFSLPAFIQANIGHLASPDFYSSFGFFFGAGYGYFISNKKSDSGISLTTGLRFWFLQKSFTLRFTKIFLNQSGNLLNEFSLQLNVGAYLQSVKRNNSISKFMKPFQK
jgi:hypothetical protein